MRQINKIIIHCSATYPDMDIGVEEIRDWHVNERGWSDIGYHYVIRRDGSVEAGRDEETIGAHAYGHNDDSLGICMVGGLAREGRQACNFTTEQWPALAELVARLLHDHDAEIIGHNDVSEKDCPTFDVKAWWVG